MNTSENNKLIAEFLGYKYETTKFTKCVNRTLVKLYNPNTPTGLPLLKIYEENSIKFHKDWNWLMLAVQQIEGIEIVMGDRDNFRHFQKVLAHPIYTPLEKIYKEIVLFIEWYNKECNL